MSIESYKTLYKNKRNGSEVRQNSDSISLYFNQEILQSKMWLKTPEELPLSYTRYMLFPLINIDPYNILLIGLGGGSFVRFFNHHFPNAKITAVDKSEEVIKLATKYFKTNQDKCEIHNACGYDFLHNSGEQYNLILIDAFDGRGMAPRIYSKDFFNECSKHMSDNSAISCNIWCLNKKLHEEVLGDFSTIFNRPAQIPIPNRSNKILLSFSSNSDYNIHLSRHKINALENKLGLEFSEITKSYKRANLTLWQNLTATLQNIYKQE
ncbi:MAG: hypothetical protein OCC45_02785 [Desulfotalea sp.]